MANNDLDQVFERLRTIESNLRRVLQANNLEWEEPTATDGIPDEVLQMIRDGNRIGATQKYRELTGCGLSEANNVVSNITL